METASLRSPDLYAAIDMGTNTFKLLIVLFDSLSCRFIPLYSRKDHVLLGRDSSSSFISLSSQSRAIECLRAFQNLLRSRNVSRFRIVATSAIREAGNQSAFLDEVKEKLGFEVSVLSGSEEAKLIYLGVLQFLPVYDRRVLTVDIGGGSTEFVIGKRGKIMYARSLNLGHVTLTQQFVGCDLVQMRERIRTQIRESGLVEEVKNLGFEVVVGSSGTIRAVEKAVRHGYGCGEAGNGDLDMVRRGWRFSREELKGVVERLCSGEKDKVWRDNFIAAGEVLLEEIFELVGIQEMQVSGYALGEGVVAEMISEVSRGCHGLNANADVRWRSVLRLAMKFNGKNKMNVAGQCGAIAKDMFEGLRKCIGMDDSVNTIGFRFDDKDLEYLEDACLLHNIGIFHGKKGYHKKSCDMIMKGEDLDGYAKEEIELIALLTRHHRKKFPRLDHASFLGFSTEEKQKIRVLCLILRMSVVIQRCRFQNLREVEVCHSCQGYKLVFRETLDGPPPHGYEESIAKDVEKELQEELEHFEEVLHQKFSVVIHPVYSESSAG